MKERGQWAHSNEQPLSEEVSLVFARIVILLELWELPLLSTASLTEPLNFCVSSELLPVTAQSVTEAGFDV